jgi:hypothetical protein
MSIFEPATVLALLKSLEPVKKQKAFEAEWKEKVRKYASLQVSLNAEHFSTGKIQSRKLAGVSTCSVN